MYFFPGEIKYTTTTASLPSLILEREIVELYFVTLTSLSVAMTMTQQLEWEPWATGFIPMDQLSKQGVMDKISTLTEVPVLCV